MGEVLISKGNMEDGRYFIKSYKEKYPKHTAFHNCLREDLLLSKIGKLF